MDNIEFKKKLEENKITSLIPFSKEETRKLGRQLLLISILNLLLLFGIISIKEIQVSSISVDIKSDMLIYLVNILTLYFLLIYLIECITDYKSKKSDFNIIDIVSHIQAIQKDNKGLISDAKVQLNKAYEEFQQIQNSQDKLEKWDYFKAHSEKFSEVLNKYRSLLNVIEEDEYFVKAKLLLRQIKSVSWLNKFRFIIEIIFPTSTAILSIVLFIFLKLGWISL